MSDALPKLRQDLSYHPDHENPGRFYVKDPLRRQFFNFNELQVAMMKGLDGKRSAEEVHDYLGTEYEVEVPLEKIERFVERLERDFLLDVTSYRVDDVKTRKAIRKRLRKRGLTFRAKPRRGSREAELFREGAEQATEGDPCRAAACFGSVLEINPQNERARDALECIHEAFFDVNGNASGVFQSTMIRVLQPDKFLARFDRRFGGFIYSTPGVLVITAIILASIAPIVEIMSRPEVFAAFSPWDIVMFELVILPGMLVHELGHGLSCKHYGGTVDDLGVMFIYGVLPAAYCDTSDTYLFKERRHKVIVYLSGLVPHMIYQSVFWFIVAAMDPTIPGWNGMVVALLVTLWVNFTNIIPLVPLDGYYALADWLGINNLRGRSFDYLKARLASVFLGVKKEVDVADDRERRIFLIFAVLAAIYTVIYIYGAWISFLLPYVVDTLGVVGVVLTVLYFGNLFGKIMFRHLSAFARFVWRERAQVFTIERTLVFAGLGAAVTITLMSSWPVYVDGAVVIEPQRRAIIRATEPGLIAEIRVEEGERVEAGQVVAVFRDDSLERDHAAATAGLLKAEHELERLRRGSTDEERSVARAAVGVHSAERSAARGRLAESRRLAALDVGDRDSVREARGKVAVTAGKARVSRAEAALASAGARSEEIAGAEAEIRRWKSELAEIEERARRLELRAPIAGVVIGADLSKRRGERLERGDSLVEIQDVSELRARIVPHAGEPLSGLEPGQRLSMRIAGDPHRGIDVAVGEVLPPAENDKDARLVVISTGIERSGLRAGMSGHARIYGPERSLAYRLIAVPIIRLVDYDLWRWL